MSVQSQLPRTSAVLQEGIDRGYHFGGQVAIFRNGQAEVDQAFGCLRPDGGEPVRTDHIYCWRSAGKPWTVVPIINRIAAGSLSLDVTIDRWLVPTWTDHLAIEFGDDAALVVAPPTLLQVLTHTTSLSPVDAGWPRCSWRESLARVFAAKLKDGSLPGDIAAYDPQAGWFALAAILIAVDSLPLEGGCVSRVVAEEVFQRVGVEAFLSLSASEIEAVRERIAPQFNTLRGATDELPLSGDAALVRPAPGSSCRGPISSLAKLYAALLDSRKGSARLLPQEGVELMTRRHREGMTDATFMHQLDFGLGVIVNSNRYGVETVPYGFGRYASEATFGHGGAQCAMGFADPEHDLAVAWVLNGLPGEPRHNKRNREINSAIYEDLGLA